MKKISEQIFSIGNLFYQSALELKRPKTMVVTAMMIAVSVVIGMFTITPTSWLFFKFTYLVYAIVGMLYGPVVGGIFGLGADVVEFLIFPKGAWFFGFTLNAMLRGVLFGIFLYKNNACGIQGKLSVFKISFVKILDTISINLFLNTYWLSVLGGKSMWAMLPPRLLKNVALLPIEIILLVLVLRFVAKNNKIIK